MFDLNLLCVGQRTPTITIPYNKNIWLINSNNNYKKRKKYYYQIAPLMNYIDGIWYELYCSENEIGGTMICDYSRNSGTYPYWISSTAIQEDLQSLIIKEEYYESFIEILKFLIHKSPIRTVLFLCRFQSNGTEVICGTIKLDEFLVLLKNNEILTNICYSIYE